MGRSERNSVLVDIFNNPWKKHRTLRTFALYCSFLALGLAASVYGPTLVSMEILLGTDTKSIAASIAGNALGYLGGSILAGFIYQPLNKELLFTICIFGLAISTGIAPFAGHLYLFIAACVCQGAFMGIVDTGGQPYIMKLWEGHRYKEPVMQAAHLVWSIGTTIGPFIIHPFLADISDIIRARNISIFSVDDSLQVMGVPSDMNLTSLANLDDDNMTLFEYDFIPTTEIVPNMTNTTDGSDVLARVGYVRMAYVVVAILAVLCSICYIVAYFLLKPSCLDRNRQNKDDEEKTQYTKAYQCFRVSLLIFMFLLFFIYAWVETVPGSFLAAFVVKGLNWSNKQGALVTAVYWGAIGVGRLVGVFVSACIIPRDMIIINVTLTLVGFLMIMFFKYLEILVWLGSVIAGLGMGTLVPSATLWVGDYMELTGAVSAVLLTASSIGMIGAPAITGYLFDLIGHMAFVYILVISGVLQMVIFIGALFYARNNSGQRRSKSTTRRKKMDLDGDEASQGLQVEMKSLKRPENSLLEQTDSELKDPET